MFVFKRSSQLGRENLQGASANVAIGERQDSPLQVWIGGILNVERMVDEVLSSHRYWLKVEIMTQRRRKIGH